MPAVLIAVGWAVLILAFAGNGRGFRESAVLALTVVHATAVISTELLSIPRAITVWTVAAIWTLLLVATLWPYHTRVAQALARARGALVGLLEPVGISVLAILGLLVTGTLFSALLYPITNYDSLTYHLPRVVFWLQRRSVQLFPTPEGRQLFSSTLVEYLVLQLRVLSGSFALSNLVQWASYVHVIVAASLVAKRLGAKRTGQMVAAVVAATTPMAVLQASTTQNDLTSALWVLAAVYWMLGYLQKDATPSLPTEVLAAGAAAGLALQAKSTAYLLLAPFAVWAAVALLAGKRWREFARALGIVVCVVAALNAGTFIRNAGALEGDVLALNAPGNDHILVQDRSAEALVTNTLKNSTMLIGTPSQSANAAMARVLRRIVSLYRGDFENVLSKEEADRPYEIGAKITNHDMAGAPLTAVVIVLSLLSLLLASRFGRGPRVSSSGLGAYVLCSGMALVLLSSLIKWNPFINRVLLGAVLLWAPVVGVAATRLRLRMHALAKAAWVALMGVLVLWAIAVMLLNTTNRLLPYPIAPIGNRDLGWWNTSQADLQTRILVPEYERPIETIAKTVRARDARRIGLRVRTRNLPLYPLLASLPDRQFGYLGETVLPERLRETFTPDLVVEVVWVEELDSALADSTPRGQMLSEPLHAGDVVFLLYLPSAGSDD